MRNILSAIKASVKEAYNHPIYRVKNKGIAIGPILFVVAILAVLVSAIASGSGSFNTSTTSESNRILATTVIQQGQNLRSGFERLMATGFSADEIVVSQSFTGGVADRSLYSTTGGGLTFQTPPTNAISVSTNIWNFVPNANLDGIGTAAANDYIAVLQVRQAVCSSINAVLFGNSDTSATTPHTLTAAPSVAAATAADSNGTSTPPSANTFATAVAGNALSGRAAGCAQNGGNYYYYTLLSAE